MQTLVLIVMAVELAQPAGRLARALPCGAGFVPMAMRIAATPPPPQGERRIAAPRRDVPRPLPCFRLAAA